MIQSSKKLLPIGMHLVFWSWNAVFLSTILFGILPIVLVPLTIEVFEGYVPLDFALTSLALILVPLAATIIGAKYLCREPHRLFALFYGVEAPIVFWLFVRLFMVRELTAATTYALLVMLAGGVVFATTAFRDDGDRPAGRITAGLATIAHAVCLVTGLYLGALIAFYAVPAGAAFGGYLIGFEWLRDVANVFRYTNISSAIFALMFLGLFAITASLFVLMPPAVAVLYVRRWAAVFSGATQRIGLIAASVLTAVTVGGLVAGYQLSNEQPQRDVIARLDREPQTDAERRALLADREHLREGLLNAYLAPYRYVGPAQSDHHIRELYARNLGLGEEDATAVQGWYNALARPLLYDGASTGIGDDRVHASALYERFFDEPIQKGEKDTVLRAINATYDSAGREAGLLDAGGRKVHLERQDVTVTEHGTYADVELHETYANQTFDQQEVFYAFSVPEGAVLTGLWLGDTDRRDRAFPFVLATRGAAQAVYKAEVQRRVDPALLEQVGPRQYRLRAFPVPPKPHRGRELAGDSTAPTRLHLWMTLKVLPGDGVWSLPRAIERRNIYADRHTERRLNGGVLHLDDVEAWLPHEVRAIAPQAREAATYAMTATAAVRAEPIGGERPRLAPGQRFAVILDRSYSMGRHVDALADAFDWLHDTIEPQHQLELYFTSGDGRGEAPTRIVQPRGFDPRDVVYYGGQDPTAMLQEFDRLRAGTTYAAVIVLTDEGSYALAKDAPRLASAGGPLWFVHVGGELPLGYDDGTLELIQSSKGGVATDLPRVFTSLAYAQTPGFIAIDDNYVWRAVAPTPDARTDDGFLAIAARQYLADATTHGPLDLGTLDALHGIARRFSIVTPYSSMLVLVNDAQRQALAAAEAKADRFDREVESGSEQLSTPTGGFPVITATPEPEAWALLVVVAGALFSMARRARVRPRTA